jgi:predicted porin
MKSVFISAIALIAALSGAQAADLPTKKGAPVAPPPAKNCFSDILTYFDSSPADCPLSAYGITVYATVDMGVGYESHGTPFNRDVATGVEELVQKNSNKAQWLLTPGGISQSQVGVKIKEPIGFGWSVVGEVATGFDPYSLMLSNGPASMASNTQTPLPNQSSNADSSRAGQWDNSVAYGGFSHPLFGTLTAGRENSLTLDGINAYDPMGGSYAFSPIGWSGKAPGAGSTEDARVNTSIKYAVQYNNFRASALGQFGGFAQGNGSNGEWQVGVGGDFFQGLSVDAIYTQIKDQVNLGTYNGPVPTGAPADALKATLSNNDSIMLLAKYKWNQFTTYGGWERITYNNPSDPYAGGFTSIGDFPVTGVNSTNYNKALDFDILWTGVKYAITDRVDLTGAYYLYIQHDFRDSPATESCAGNTTAPAPGYSPQGTASSKCQGYMNAFSAMVDYRPLKRVDLYAGLMYSRVSGGLATGYLHSDNVDPTVGFRVRF